MNWLIFSVKSSALLSGLLPAIKNFPISKWINTRIFCPLKVSLRIPVNWSLGPQICSRIWQLHPLSCNLFHIYFKCVIFKICHLQFVWIKALWQLKNLVSHPLEKLIYICLKTSDIKVLIFNLLFCKAVFNLCLTGNFGFSRFPFLLKLSFFGRSFIAST